MLPIKYVFSLIIILWLACSCEKGKKAQSTQVNIDSLQTELQTLNDSVNEAWQQLIATDNAKEQSLKSLLEEIGKMRNYNKSLYDSLLKEQTELTNLHYNTPQTLTSAKIDNYDAKSDRVKNGVYRLGDTTPGFSNCAVCTELKQNIEKADNETLINRINYDRHAQAYNDFIRAHAADLAEAKPQYKDLSPLPLFQIAL